MAQIKPVLITTDIFNSTVSGLEVVRAGKNHTSSVPVIVVSGSGDEREAMDAGAFAFFRKPFNCDDLLAAVARALGN